MSKKTVHSDAIDSKSAVRPEADSLGARKPVARSAGDECKSGTPLGDSSPDEPANTLPAEPVSISKVRPQKAGGAAATGEPEDKIDETPALHGEDDIPSDGSDPEGEAMVRKVPARKGNDTQTSSSPRDSVTGADARPS